MIKKKISIIVRNDKGEVVAVCLNDIETEDKTSDDISMLTEVRQEAYPNMYMIVSLLNQLMENQHLFSLSKEIVNLQMLCVSTHYSGRGIASKLIELTKEMTKESGIHLIISEATSDFSYRALSKAGFQDRLQLDYNTFVIDGKKPFETLTGPHQSAYLMLCLL